MDIWRVLRPKASNRELLIVGRVVVLILVVIGIVWIPIVSRESSCYFFTLVCKPGCCLVLNKKTVMVNPPLSALSLFNASVLRAP